ncbi:Peptidoglycan/LPS O-acetylase OafA/YrhL, contains acyltransferase and SGNH-hydrolase domains [Blastococcus aurantiacus]|uniref:Peptidoglycan/LPS O-acetylase OafA/YrhL, contains acyltransferase and SGNH-hydrolase domains n=1 Tax=Blastococcus aurantiacus TaxID=1550231 RepID=A0A1G7JHA1_9ACTN|nr:acyltransferase family protein [Blastococcus aurantiacus]SDF24298.1 Peptidoglycan/LPS O-acetylase OafA/YrhL, contains acyltransferase and SGNH-hydrolase domains [Blastococcus aurantiacus]
MAGASTPADPRRPEPDTAGGSGAPAEKQHFRPDIQGLRAVAVGLVVADHVFGWPAGGFIGVDVFFVISGFLITSLLVRERSRTGRISFRAFYARRARRLLPAALVALAATTVAAYLVFLGGRFRETVTDVVWAALFGANINFARQGTDYFEGTAAPSLVQHFWSLSVEEQFYLVWPALILLAFTFSGRGGRRRGAHAAPSRRSPALALWLLLGTVTAASFAWSVHATGASPVTAYFSTFTRAWELGVGALVAISVSRLQRLPSPLRALLAWAGLAVVAGAAFVIDDGTPFPGTAASLPVLGAALLLAWGGAPGGPGTRWALGSAPAGFLGAISYSLYLWHWPVLIIAGALLTPGSTVFYAVAVGVALAAATVSYYCIEQPVLHTNWLLPHRPVDPARARPVFVRAGAVGLVAAGVAAMTVVAVVVAPWGQGGNARADAARAAAQADEAALDAGGPPLTPLQQDIRAATLATEWPADLDPSLEELPAYGDEVWPAGCLVVDEKGLDECGFGDQDAERTAVVLGDSYGAAWVPALASGLVPRGWYVQALTMAGCGNVTAPTLLYGKPFTDCTEHREWAIERVLDTRPDLVVLSNAWTADFVDDSTDRATLYRDGLTEVVRRVQASGARIVILAGPPGSANLQECPTGINGPDDCLEGPVKSFATEVATEREVAAATGALAIDPEQWFCIDGLCPTFVAGTAVYTDGRHITVEYGERIGPEVVAAFGLP